MAPDFRDMASKTKAAHEQLKAEADERRKDRESADAGFVQAAIAALNRDVVPLLTQAKEAFEEDGIRATISEHFDVHNRPTRVLPCVSFRCQGPKRASDGYQYEAAAVFFSSDGNSVFAGSGTSSIDREAKHPIGQAPVGGCETLITKAIETALNAYFNERERWK